MRWWALEARYVLVHRLEGTKPFSLELRRRQAFYDGHSIAPRLPRDASRVAPRMTSSKSKRCLEAQLCVVQLCFASVPEKFGIRRDANATARAQPRSGHRRGQAESEAHRGRRLCTATARAEPLGLAQPSVTTTRYRNKNSSQNRTFHGENGVAPRVSVVRKLRYPTHLPLISGRRNRSIARANSEAEKWTLFWAGCCETLGSPLLQQLARGAAAKSFFQAYNSLTAFRLI